MTLPDLPVDDPKHDLLDRNRLAQALGRILSAADLGTPLATAIYGDWGTGKTSVLRMIESALPANSVRLWFDAWRYARQSETLWRALLLAVVDSLRETLGGDFQGDQSREEQEQEQELDRLVERLYRSRAETERGPLRLDLRSAAAFGLDLAVRYASLGTVSVHDILGTLKGDEAEKAAKLIHRAEVEHFRAQVTSLDQFYRELKALLRKHGIGQKGGRRLYVFIDDLDRCLPEEAVSALEAIKLFLDFEGCVFVLGMDRRVLEQGIAVRYQAYHAAMGEPVDPRQYLDKIIQLPVTLPPLGERQIETYLAGLGGVAADTLIGHCHVLVRAGTPTNPRSVKRVINSLMLMLELAGTRSLSELPAKEEAQRLAKLAVLQVCQPDLFRRVADQPRFLKVLEAAVRNPNTPSEAKTALEGAAHRPVIALLGSAPFFDSLSDVDLARLVVLGARTA